MKKNSEISRMFAYAGNRHWLTILGMVLAGLSTMMSMIPSSVVASAVVGVLLPCAACCVGVSLLLAC